MTPDDWIDTFLALAFGAGFFVSLYIEHKARADNWPDAAVSWALGLCMAAPVFAAIVAGLGR